MAKVAICKELGGFTVRSCTNIPLIGLKLGPAFDKDNNHTWKKSGHVRIYCTHETVEQAREFAEGLRREVIEVVSI